MVAVDNTNLSTVGMRDPNLAGPARKTRRLKDLSGKYFFVPSREISK